jgi:hypothetical protein
MPIDEINITLFFETAYYYSMEISATYQVSVTVVMI